MPRILYLTAHDVHGTPYPDLAARWLANGGFKVTCLCRESGPPALEGVVPAEVEYVFFRGGSGGAGRLKEYARAIAAAWRARRKPYDLCYVYGQPVVPAALAGLLGVPGSRIIYHNPDFYEPSAHPIRSRLERRLARKAGHTVLLEPSRARVFQSLYGLARPPLVIPANLPLAWPVPERSLEVRAGLLAQVDGKADTRLIIHHGPYADVRRSDKLLSALAGLPRRFALVFTGVRRDGDAFRECERAVRDLGLAGRVAYVERCAFGELFKYTRACDMGVLLYRNDGLGNFFQSPGRLTEYAACGLPVVASNYPGLELMTLRYGLGECCETEDPKDIGRAIMAVDARLAAEPDTHQRIRRAFEEHLCYDRFGGKLVSYVTDICTALGVRMDP